MHKAILFIKPNLFTGSSTVGLIDRGSQNSEEMAPVGLPGHWESKRLSLLHDRMDLEGRPVPDFDVPATPSPDLEWEINSNS